MKIFAKKCALTLALLGIANGACDRSESKLTDTFIPGDNPYVGGLGYAYDSGRAAIIGSKCANVTSQSVADFNAVVNGKNVKSPADALKSLLAGEKTAAEKAAEYHTTGQFVGQHSADLKYESSLSYQQMADALNGSLALGIEAGGLSIGAGAAYARRNAKKDYSITKSIVVAVKGGSRQIDNSGKLPLTDLGEQAKSEPQRSRVYCGDEFITQIDFGALFIATLTIELANENDKERIEGHIDGNIGGVVKIAGDFTKALAKLSGKETVRLEIKQLGGNPTELGKAFGAVEVMMAEEVHEGGGEAPEIKTKVDELKKDGEEKKTAGDQPKTAPAPGPKLVKVQSNNAILECGINAGQIGMCLGAFNKIFDYAKDEFLGKQLNFSTGDGLVPIGYHTKSYVTFGDPFKQLKADAYTERTLSAHRRTIVREMASVEQDLERIDAIVKTYGPRLSSRQVVNLKTLERAGHDRLAMISSAMRKCFSASDGIETLNAACEAAVLGEEFPVDSGKYPKDLLTRLAAIDYDRSALMVTPSRFTDWCIDYYDNKALSDKSQNTVRSIIERYGNGEFQLGMDPNPSVTGDKNADPAAALNIRAKCQQLADKMQDMVKITLEDVGSVEPLTSFKRLADISLTAHRDGIGSLLALGEFKKLTDLYLKGEPITSLDGLENNQSLVRIVIDNSTITSLSPLDRLRDLEEVRITNATLHNISAAGRSASLQSLAITDNIGSVDSWSIIDALANPALTLFEVQQNVAFKATEHEVKPNKIVKVTVAQLLEACRAHANATCEDNRHLVTNGRIVQK